MHYFFKNLSTLEKRADNLNIFLQKGTHGYTVVLGNTYQTYMGHLNMNFFHIETPLSVKNASLGLCLVLDSSILAQRGHYGAVTGGLGFCGLKRLVQQVVNIEDLGTSIDSNLDPHGIV